MKKNNEIKSKKIRSTSALSKEHLNQSEKENTNIENNNNTNSNYKKGLHHRKRTSSYFLGSYIPSSNILESNQENDDDDININLNINNNLYNNLNENSKDKDVETSNEIKNKLIYNLINNDSNNNISLSFPSYDESNTNNSITIKPQNSSNKKSNNNKNNNKNENYNRNNIYYEMAKDAENSSSCKSFISFKNSLKYIKDKDERTTPSYLLALQTDKKNGNNNYVTSSNIIEEEKSSMLESRSEYSNKKEIFHFEKKKLQENTNEKNNYILEDINGNNKDNNNNKDIEDNKDVIGNNMNLNNYKDKYGMKKQISDNNSIQDESNKISSALNEIIIKNNKKEENRRKYLTKNKMTLLNTFFTMSKTLQMNEDKINNKIKIENYKDYKDVKDKGINKIIDKKENNNVNYYMKRKYVNKFLKNSFPNKRVVDPHINLEGQYLNSMNNLNNNMKLNESKRCTINSQFNQDNNTNNDEVDANITLKKNINKIPHLSNVKKKFQKKLMNDSASNIIDTPFRKLKALTSNNNSSSRKNSLKKEKNDRNFQTLKRLENLNKALSFIREKKKIIKSSTNNDKKKCNNNTYNFSNGNNYNLNNKPNGHSTSFFTNSNANTNTRSHSQSKEKNKKIPKFLRKVNSGPFNSKGELLSQSGEDSSAIESNKKQIVLCLKYKLSFHKLYEKIDALEKINSTNLSNKSFFLILCDYKDNQFFFSGLFKYYHDKERYIKIYGDERSPNYILFKDIKGRMKYTIYEDNNQINSSISSFILINYFRFTSNALIIIKN